MEIFTLLLLLVTGFYVLKFKDQKRRIALLAQVLGKYQIEKMMETLMQSYNRALSEPDASRQGQILALQQPTEQALSEQFNRFAADFSRVDAPDARVSTVGFAFGYADRLLPSRTFDLRQAFSIHAQGLARAMDNPRGLSAKSRAFHITAELLLMQHTCHWFCRSRAVASSRLLVRHKTLYAQLLASVLPQTRAAYTALMAP